MISRSMVSLVGQVATTPSPDTLMASGLQTSHHLASSGVNCEISKQQSSTLSEASCECLSHASSYQCMELNSTCGVLGSGRWDGGGGDPEEAVVVCWGWCHLVHSACLKEVLLPRALSGNKGSEGSAYIVNVCVFADAHIHVCLVYIVYIYIYIGEGTRLPMNVHVRTVADCQLQEFIHFNYTSLKHRRAVKAPHLHIQQHLSDTSINMSTVRSECMHLHTSWWWCNI